MIAPILFVMLFALPNALGLVDSPPVDYWGMGFIALVLFLLEKFIVFNGSFLSYPNRFPPKKQKKK